MKKRLACLLMAILILGGGTAMAEFTEETWYGEALEECVVSPGNNLRLKNVIQRAREGETLTLAMVGGSITEGALASDYKECWAKRFAKQFARTYGAEEGKYIYLVNAGVGGTSSTFGWMRYGRDVLDRIPEADPDGLPDLVVIEYAVNDWEEATGFRCYESMVKEILSQPNQPAVILLFSVAQRNWNMQTELQKIGARYDLPMVSIKDGIYPHLDKDYPKADFFADEYHPNSKGHQMMADAMMRIVQDADAAEISAADVNLAVNPVYGTDFMNLRTVYGDRETEGITVERGGFDQTDPNAYKNKPVGLVCGKNFFHSASSSADPLKITGSFRKCVIAWKASNEASFGTAEVLVDGVVKKTLKGGNGKWGQSEPVLVLDEKEAAEHTVEIRVKEEGKCFTITAVSVQ